MFKIFYTNVQNFLYKCLKIMFKNFYINVYDKQSVKKSC